MHVQKRIFAFWNKRVRDKRHGTKAQDSSSTKYQYLLQNIDIYFKNRLI